jgi:uncharacterized protein
LTAIIHPGLCFILNSEYLLMKALKIFILSTLIFVSLHPVFSANFSGFQSENLRMIQDAVNPIALPFSYDQVTLGDSRFKTAMELDKRFLLNLEPDRLLSGFRKNAGMEPKAERYGGWESMGLAGHSLGHYLTAYVLALRLRERTQKC